MEATTPQELLHHLNATESVHAPPCVFVAGDPSFAVLWFKVSIVGSRRASDEGLRRAARLARFLVGHDVTVVSGLAEGIDAAAHRAAIEHGGRTIAVIGTGLDQAYPPRHRELQNLIARDHLVVSQFPNGTPPRKGNFPQRNRTMALISDATVIVEAGETSGTLHQGWEALRLGRPLFLMRSLVDREDVTWPAKMMEYGARKLGEPEEILQVLETERAGPVDEVAF
jgi:DNA processing protein